MEAGAIVLHQVASLKVTFILHQDDIEKVTWRTQQYFTDSEVESTSSYSHCINVILSAWKIYEISTNFQRGVSMANDVSSGFHCLVSIN